MTGDKPAGAVAGVAVVLAVCCGLHALLVAGGITVVGLRAGSWALAVGGVIVLALAAARHRRRRRVPAPPGHRVEDDGGAHRSRTG